MPVDVDRHYSQQHVRQPRRANSFGVVGDGGRLPVQPIVNTEADRYADRWHDRRIQPREDSQQP